MIVDSGTEFYNIFSWSIFNVERRKKFEKEAWLVYNNQNSRQ